MSRPKTRYYRMTDAARAVARERSRLCASRRYVRLRAAGLCAVCGFEDVDPVAGHADKCRDCARTTAEADTRRRNARKVPCVTCGEPRMPENPSGRCRGCLSRALGETRRKVRPVCPCGQTVTLRNKSGYCSPCNARRQAARMNARRATQEAA